MKCTLLGLVVFSALCFACVGETADEKAPPAEKADQKADDRAAVSDTPAVKVEQGSVVILNTDKGSSGGAPR